jgi:hypothetical protein
MVTVIFSHQGALETRVSDEFADATPASAPAAEARIRAAILRTSKLLRARQSGSSQSRALRRWSRRSGDLIAAANLTR